MAAQAVQLHIITLADQVISADDGKKSIIGIFDKIFVRQLPASHPRMSLFLALQGAAHSKESIELKFEGPSGATLDTKQFEFDFGENGKANIIVNLEGFPVQETGTHTILIRHSGKRIGTTTFDVIQVQSNEQQVIH